MDSLALIIVSVLAYAIGLVILYAIIKAAVLSALRQHTNNSVTGVAVTSSIPLSVIAEEHRGTTEQPN